MIVSAGGRRRHVVGDWGGGGSGTSIFPARLEHQKVILAVTILNIIISRTSLIVLHIQGSW